MGKLGDLIKEYKIAPINSPAEREAKEAILKITESQWWKDNVGREFKMPKKYDNKKQQAIFREPQFVFIGNFIFGRHEFCERCRLYKGLLTYTNGQMVYAKPYIT